MDAGALFVLSRVAECGVLLLIGFQLRAAQLFSVTDAEAAQRLAGYLTLPAAVLQACTSLPPASWHALLGAPVVVLASSAAAAFCWVQLRSRHKRERALLAGCACGSDAPAVALPLLEALAGPAGLLAACSAAAANALAVFGGSYLLAGSAGAAFPESYAHEDGGTYRGEWRGLAKEGLGVYTYASGARYEGEWRDNVKAGRGVYYFPKGGTYEGEWAGGVMSGTGLRTYSSGKVVAGRWAGGQLESPLALWQCATAAEGAAEAALAARRVVVGGGRPSDALQLLVAQPVLWAALAGLALNMTSLRLPAWLASITAALAPANKPLMLLSAGMLLQPALPQPRQVCDVSLVVAARVVAALAVSANALVLPAAAHPLGQLSVLAAAVVLLSPLPPAALEFTRNFRLNEALAAAVRDGSQLASAPLLALLAAAAAALGLLPAALAAPPVQQHAGLAAVAASTGGATLLAAGMVVLAAAVAVAAGALQERLSADKGRVLKYAGPAAAEQQPGGGSAGGGERGGGSTAAAATGRWRGCVDGSSWCAALQQLQHCAVLAPGRMVDWQQRPQQRRMRLPVVVARSSCSKQRLACAARCVVTTQQQRAERGQQLLQTRAARRCITRQQQQQSLLLGTRPPARHTVTL